MCVCVCVCVCVRARACVCVLFVQPYYLFRAVCTALFGPYCTAVLYGLYSVVCSVLFVGCVDLYCPVPYSVLSYSFGYTECTVVCFVMQCTLCAVLYGP